MVEIDYKKIYGDWSYNKNPEINLSKTAIVVIDMQPMFSDPAYVFIKALSKRLPCDLTYFARRVKEVVIPNIARLVVSARSAGVEVCYVVTYSERDDLSDMVPWMQKWIRDLEDFCGEQFYRKWTRGAEICEELKPERDEIVAVKRSGSAFASSLLPMILRNMGIETLLFTGCNTNGCVFSSALIAHEMGWNAILVGDTTACWAPEQQELFEQHIFPSTYGPVMSTNEVIGLMSAKKR